MVDRDRRSKARFGPRYEEIRDPEFQRRWRESRRVNREHLELAFRHGLEAQDRFADRPFEAVAGFLRQSWEAMGPPAPWISVDDVVRSGYERGRTGEGVVDLAPEALARFVRRTAGGSALGPGSMGERTFLGAAEPVREEPPGTDPESEQPEDRA